MRRATFRQICFVTLVAGAAAAFFAAMSITRPRVELRITGFTTNVITGSNWGLSTKYVCAVIQMTNRGTWPVIFTADVNTPRYITLRQSVAGRTESAHDFFCGFAVQDRTLSPGQSVTFSAIIDPDVPCRIAVPYRRSNLKGQLRGLLPAALVRRFSWFNSESTILTPVIRMDGKDHA